MSNKEFGIWEVLGIAPTMDKKEVKKAYAEAVKQCHPEEEPEAFQDLYKAYQAALKICALGSKMQPALRREDPSKIQISLTETVPKAKESSVPESDTKQEDNESYKRICQLFCHIPYEKKSKALSEDEQDMNKAEIKKYEALFAQNSQKQQEALVRWESLWRQYTANPSSHNNTQLLQFMYNCDFLLIRGLDSVPYQIAMFLTKHLDKIPKDFVYVLWDIFDYRQYDAIAEQALYGSGYQKLYWILKKECGRYAEMSVFDSHGKLAKLAKRVFYIGLFSLIVVVLLGLTI